MPKRLIDPDWKVLRKLKSSLREAWFYCWDKADAIGVYEYDAVYMAADLGFSVSMDDLLKLPNAKKISAEKILFTDFIEVNYVQLKKDYNPHKPAWRALVKNNLTINSSLNQACYKFEEEEEKEDVNKDEEEGKDEEEKSDPVFSNQVKFIITDLNQKCNTDYRPSSKKTQELIRARMREGFVLTDFEYVNTVKAMEWMGTEHEKYLRPETLYGSKFEGYKNQKVNVAGNTKTGRTGRGGEATDQELAAAVISRHAPANGT